MNSCAPRHRARGGAAATRQRATVYRRVSVYRARAPKHVEEACQSRRRRVVDRVTLRKHHHRCQARYQGPSRRSTDLIHENHVIEHVEQAGRGLVNRADYRVPRSGCKSSMHHREYKHGDNTRTHLSAQLSELQRLRQRTRVLPCQQWRAPDAPLRRPGHSWARPCRSHSASQAAPAPRTVASARRPRGHGCRLVTPSACAQSHQASRGP